MSELDDRLVEIVNNLEGDWFDNERVVTEAITQIKQAFEVEGYRHVLPRNLHPDIVPAKPEKLMTGQEFYDRFEEELQVNANSPRLEWKDVIKAARKAAGLKP